MSRNVDITDKIVKHGNDLLDIFPHCTETDPVKLCKKLRRLETEGERLAVAYCNGKMQSDAYDASSDKLMAKVNSLLGNGVDTSAVVAVFHNGDPRGYALKIDDEWMRANARDSRLHRDWGGYGIIAPDFREC